MRLIALLSVAALAACTPAAPPPPPEAPAVMVGVLEDRPGSVEGAPNAFVVRATFFKDGDGWRAFDTTCDGEGCLAEAPGAFPGETAWTIALDGQTLGEVTAATPEAWTYYSDLGQQNLAAGATAPTSGERSMDFAGFKGVAVYRPLVASSSGHVSDPEGWAPATASADIAASVRAAFRVKFPSAENCVSPEQNVAAPWAYAESDVAVSDAQTSSEGWTIATATLGGYLCDGQIDASMPYAPQVFAISPTGEARFLEAGVRFLDSGDFDGDGQSELVFAIDDYNRGGYVLFTNNFADHATFSFSYH